MLLTHPILSVYSESAIPALPLLAILVLRLLWTFPWQMVAEKAKSGFRYTSVQNLFACWLAIYFTFLSLCFTWEVRNSSVIARLLPYYLVLVFPPMHNSLPVSVGIACDLFLINRIQQRLQNTHDYIYMMMLYVTGTSVLLGNSLSCWHWRTRCHVGSSHMEKALWHLDWLSANKKLKPSVQ